MLLAFLIVQQKRWMNLWASSTCWFIKYEQLPVPVIANSLKKISSENEQGGLKPVRNEKVSFNRNLNQKRTWRFWEIRRFSWKWLGSDCAWKYLRWIELQNFACGFAKHCYVRQTHSEKCSKFNQILFIHCENKWTLEVINPCHKSGGY